jgi:hypothetical protein
LEGVYFSGRELDEFKEKTRKVIETTIRKVQDLNNLRGLVMGEVSELDVLMEKIIVKYFSTSERIKVFHRKVTEDREKSIRNRLQHDSCDKQCKSYLRKLQMPEIASKIDTSQKAHAIHALIKDINKDNRLGSLANNFMLNFDTKIIQVRNKLAHCESRIQNGMEILVTRYGNEQFGPEDFKRIRKDIIVYHNFLDDLYRRL